MFTPADVLSVAVELAILVMLVVTTSLIAGSKGGEDERR